MTLDVPAEGPVIERSHQMLLTPTHRKHIPAWAFCWNDMVRLENKNR